jgi:hypothetical protein
LRIRDLWVAKKRGRPGIFGDQVVDGWKVSSLAEPKSRSHVHDEVKRARRLASAGRRGMPGIQFPVRGNVVEEITPCEELVPAGRGVVNTLGSPERSFAASHEIR